MVAFTFSREDLNLIETAPVPVRYVTDIGRIDVIEDRLIVTLYDLQPGDGIGRDAVIVDKVGISITNMPRAVQFVTSVLAQIGWRMMSNGAAALQ